MTLLHLAFASGRAADVDSIRSAAGQAAGLSHPLKSGNLNDLRELINPAFAMATRGGRP